jgi:Sec-independent protein translocase protein TatA
MKKIINFLEKLPNISQQLAKGLRITSEAMETIEEEIRNLFDNDVIISENELKKHEKEITFIINQHTNESEKKT